VVADPLSLALDVIASLQLCALLVRFRDPDEEGARAAVEVADRNGGEGGAAPVACLTG
jgi:hypothetical protein